MPIEVKQAVLAVMVAALVLWAGLLAWRNLHRRRLTEMNLAIHRAVDGILNDVEWALRRLRESDLDTEDNIQVDSCLDRLTRLLERAGAVACVCSELCGSPAIARTRKTSELLRLLRINEAQIRDIRRKADQDLLVLEGWIEALGGDSRPAPVGPNGRPCLT
jgi:hypothetical protein